MKRKIVRQLSDQDSGSPGSAGMGGTARRSQKLVDLLPDFWFSTNSRADVAQLVEQRIRNA